MRYLLHSEEVNSALNVLFYVVVKKAGVEPVHTDVHKGRCRNIEIRYLFANVREKVINILF